MQDQKDNRKTQKSASKNQNAVALGRLGGLSRSPAKQAAARKNGKLGGKRKQIKKENGQ